MGKHVDDQWIDAIVRAARTFYTSVGVDILVAIGVGLTLLIQEGDVMSPIFWSMVAALIVRSIVTGVATYFVRLKVTPKNVLS